MTHNLIVPDDYGYVLLSIYGLVVLYWLVPVLLVNISRDKTFTKEFMEKHFGDEHKKVFGRSPPMGGYPDMGNGRYAQRLTYEQWFKFNNAQRVHYNFLEHLPVPIVMGLFSGLFYPIPAAIAIAGFVVSRIIYTIGYITGGPNYRLPGAFLAIALGLYLTGSAGYGLTRYILKL